MISLLHVRDGGDAADFVIREQDFSSFKYLYRKTAREFATMACRECAIKLANTEPDNTSQFVKYVDNGQNHLPDGDKMLLHAYRLNPNLFYVIITSGIYSASVCKKMCLELSMITDQENLGDGSQHTAQGLAATYLKDYQDYRDFDKLSALQSDLDELRDIMVRNIETVIERGEKLDELVARSGDLSAKSKKFYKASKKLNGCCTIL